MLGSANKVDRDRPEATASQPVTRQKPPGMGLSDGTRCVAGMAGGYAPFHWPITEQNQRAPSVGIDPDQERNPPSPPTPLDFPHYVQFANQEAHSATDFGSIYKCLASLRKPQDFTPEDARVLNLQVAPDLHASQIVPDHLLENLPPLPWDQATNTDKPDQNLMSNGVAYPAAEKYNIVKAELLLENDDAYREVVRMPPKPGRSRVRLTQSRKFWVGLEKMAQYWDDSLDEYYEKPAEATEQATQDQPIEAKTAEATTADAMDTSEPPRDNGSSKRVYKGRRIGAGHEMSDDIREETMRGFLEMAAWPFQCQLAIPSLPPRLLVRKLLFPVRQTLVTGRVPLDRQTARKGILEGPMLAVQCRGQTIFREDGETFGYGQKEVCDLAREVCAMLLLAQERFREGTSEVKPGEGKWWTATPRWGGAPDEGVTGEAATRSEKENESEVGEGSMHKRSRYSNPLMASRRSARPRKLTASEKWKILEPGPSLWDKRLIYMQIGKPKDSLYDDIFMVSQLNHHVSILHLRVHRRYIECLTDGGSKTTDGGLSEHPWDVLKLRRSKWYDLMDKEQRVEAFQGLWRVFHYLVGKKEPDINITSR
ncbi:hypothetical protein PISL3812_07514 [Talaromyces islandicus]|uniref:Uncharacterized protein n=1 Tax=Talaromyces islandicus TaxID=28573 RepID=A0A0U1M5Z9_TALIS|nr:hypothetical protein PISL3812_07514 [Talaromyces islandicus]